MADAEVFGGYCNAVEDGLLHVGVDDVFGAEFGPQEGVGKAVDGAGLLIDVAHLELLGAEFAVEVEDFVVVGYVFGHLGGEDGFA